MDSAAWVSAGVLGFIGLVHSFLGERVVVQPLIASKGWSLRLGRRPSEVLLRGAWHLTTLAWFGLAAVMCGASPAVAMAVVCLVSGVAGIVWLRGHLAWPLFLLAGAAALVHEGRVPEWAFVAATGVAIAIALLAAMLHGYWAAGGRWGAAAAIPERADGTPLFLPGPVACLAVVGALLVFAGLLGWSLLGTLAWWARTATIVAAVVLAVRAIGDGRQVGFSKQERGSAFARLDDRLYTPLMVALLFGTLAALVR